MRGKQRHRLVWKGWEAVHPGIKALLGIAGFAIGVKLMEAFLAFVWVMTYAIRGY